MEGVRRARPDDVDRLAELYTAAIAEMREARGGRVFTAREVRAVPGAEDIAAAVADRDRIVLAGTYDGVVVGYAAGRCEDLRDGSRLGLVSDLYVDPEARGVGIGEALMRELLAWFRERRCDGVDGHALPGDRATKNFFEASGFSARLLVMHKKLER